MADPEAKPVDVLRESCANCGHTYSFHGKALERPCRAIGCRDKATGITCTGFALREDAPAEVREALSATA